MQFFTPITRKENNNILQKITQRLQAAKQDIPLTLLKKHVPYSILYKNEFQEWCMANKQGKACPPHGNYSYITMKSGIIRIDPVIDNKTNHLMLAECADEVRYAGTITFKDGTLIAWDNDSGGYKPEANRFLQARLPCSLFKEEGKSRVSSENKDVDGLSIKPAKQPEKAAVDIIGQAFLRYKSAKNDTNKIYDNLRKRARHELRTLEMQSINVLDASNQFISAIKA